MHASPKRAVLILSACALLAASLIGCPSPKDPTADPCAGVSCDDSNPCTDDSCLAGACQHVDNAAPCDDGSACTTGDTCADGSCQGGAAVVCPARPNDQCWGEPTCDPTAGCKQHRLAAATPCDDGNACTIGDACNETGSCAATGPATCTPAGNTGCYTAISCDPIAGCQFELKAPGALCDDGDACTGSDSCDAAGGCAGTPVTCPAGPCQVANCSPVDGCQMAPADDGTVCDDLNACTTADHCAAGKCVGTSLPCSDGDLCNGVETCDPSIGCVAGTPLACDDGNPCNGVETCGPSVGCRAGTAPVCDDGDKCTIDACDPVASCTYTPKTCDDFDACTADSCNPATGICSNVAISCDDGNACNGAESCDPATGCKPGTPLVCDDGLFCNGVESCNAVAGCMAGTPVTCDDTLGCTVDFCDEAADRCTNMPDDARCDDSNACTAESCDPVLGCTHTPIICDDSNPCTTDSCNPTTGCTYGNEPEGTQCAGGTCTSATSSNVPVCNSGAACVANSVNCWSYTCNPATGSCRNGCTSEADCAPGNYCNGAGQCVAKLALGLPCTSVNACASAYCVDNACCNAPCSGTCQSCSLPGSVGTCVMIPNGQDPDGECALACNGAGSCQ